MLPLLWEAGIVDDPCLDRSVPLHLRQHLLVHLRQNLLVRPTPFADEVKQRLVLRRYSPRRGDRSHRLHALALARQHQPHAIIPQRLGPIRMPDHARQALDISRKPRFTVG